MELIFQNRTIQIIPKMFAWIIDILIKTILHQDIILVMDYHIQHALSLHYSSQKLVKEIIMLNNHSIGNIVSRRMLTRLYQNSMSQLSTRSLVSHN